MFKSAFHVASGHGTRTDFADDVTNDRRVNLQVRRCFCDNRQKMTDAQQLRGKSSGKLGDGTHRGDVHAGNLIRMVLQKRDYKLK